MRFKLKITHYLLWIVVIGSIFSHQIFIKDDYFRRSLSFIQNIQYGDYLIQKWFLIPISFLTLLFWVISQKGLWKSFAKNLKPIIIIGVILLISHAASFQRWFEFDDYRVIGTHYDVIGTDHDYTMGLSNSVWYGIGFVYLVVRWFGTNFALYNITGLLIYFFIGITIFFIGKRVQNKSVVAVLASLFFITSPTYWRQILQMQEYIGDGFSLLLFSLAIYLLVSKFYLGAIIFYAAALEFGLSRLHYIAIPLLLISILLVAKIKSQRWEWVLTLLAFPLIFFLYWPVLVAMRPQVINYSNLLSNWPHLVRLADSIFAVSLPHALAYPLINTLRSWFPQAFYISSILGGVVVLGLVGLIVWLLKEKRFLAAKLIVIGEVMLIISMIGPTLSGIRMVQSIQPLTSQYNDTFPIAPTSYGLSATFGMMIILLGLSLVIKYKIFQRLLIILILVNSLTMLHSDTEWAKIYSAPERASNPQLMHLLPGNGKLKVIYASPPSEILSRYIYEFYELYRIREPIYIQNDAGEFIKLLEKYQPEKQEVYLFTQDPHTYEIYDHSEKLRKYYPGQLTPALLKSLTKS
ncbi:hypothetical protein HY404_00845 [Candidatus Microgenomates bacterium]|nr:hypothetical protein [Candidatus Microgenomates bacterium]